MPRLRILNWKTIQLVLRVFTLPTSRRALQEGRPRHLQELRLSTPVPDDCTERPPLPQAEGHGVATLSRRTHNPSLGQAVLAYIIPAHNEEQTVAAIIAECFRAGSELDISHEVIVVADCCSDNTASVAAHNGAKVLVREDSPSKALSVCLGVENTPADYLFFVDADCVGLRSEELNRIAAPVLDGSVSMSVGVFDYPLVHSLVQRFPWSAGERVLHRSHFPLGDERLDRYNIEIVTNEFVARDGGTTASWRMRGVRQRTKRDKYGLWAGLKRGVRMWIDISGSLPNIDRAKYLRYMRAVELWDDNGKTRQSRTVVLVGFTSLLVAARLLSELQS